MGARKRQSRSKLQQHTTRVLICSDAHHPYVDQTAWQVFLATAKAWRPHHCVIIGDFFDLYSASSFDKDPKRAQTVIDEIRACEPAVSALDKALPRNCEKHFCRGNHEDRLNRLVKRDAPALTGLVSVENELRLEERGWEIVPYGSWMKIGRIAFTHDVGHCGVNAARQSLQAFGGNLVFGHSHGGAIVYGGTADGERHVCMNVGWLGDLSQIDYGYRSQQVRNWVHGYGTVHILEDGSGYCQFHPIVNGRTVVDGKVIAP